MVTVSCPCNPCLTLHHSTRSYVCVEPGHAIGFINLPGGETWVGKQVLTMTGEEKQVPVEEVESYSSRTRFTWG